MERLIFVSADSHAGVPKELWPHYLDRRFHGLLPTLQKDNEVYPTAIFILTSKRKSTDIPEVAEAHRSGYHGLHDPGLRLADMDREGVAAELIYHGDFRLGDMFHNNTNSKFPLDAWEAGARGWNRWAADNFGFAMNRFLVVGAIGPCTDMARTTADLEWIADHAFVGTYAPGYMRHPNMAPLWDKYWEPFWSVCEDRGLAVVVHAGFGWEQGVVYPHLQEVYQQAAAAAGSSDLASLMAHADAVTPEAAGFFGEFSGTVRPRRPLWQLMLGGVFDRHPNLKLVLSEVRADWIPATLRHLDALYDAHRYGLPAKRKPSEYWHANCLVGASFIHKAEVEMRHEIGIETIAFGRDFPHPEGTWPNTKDWLRDAFAGVPEHEIRLILGENAIRFLGLDGVRLADLARRIGPAIEDVTGSETPVAPELVENFGLRGGYLKPAEGDGRWSEVNELLRADLASIGVSA